jgi:hypothetical protein
MFVRYDDKDFADINELKRMYFLEKTNSISSLYSSFQKRDVISPVDYACMS